MSHKPTFLVYGNGPGALHAVRCKCGNLTPKVATKQEAEDDFGRHLRDIQRVRMHLRGREPRLTDQRDYYRKMAESPQTDAKDRELWTRLADELDRRLSGGPPTSVQERLL